MPAKRKVPAGRSNILSQSGIGGNREDEAYLNYDPSLPPLDFREQFLAEFPIRNAVEGNTYKAIAESIKEGILVEPRSLDFELLDRIGLVPKVMKYFKVLGLERLARQQIHGYHPLATEFLCSFKLYEEAAKARVYGEYHEMNYKEMHDALGFHERGATMPDKDWDTFGPWFDLTGLHNWHSRNASNIFLRDPALMIVHKFLAYNISGKAEANKINTTELFLLWHAHKGIKVNLSEVVWRVMDNVTTTNDSQPRLFSIISQLASYWGALNLAHPSDDQKEVERRVIGFHELVRSHVIDNQGNLISHEERLKLRGYTPGVGTREQRRETDPAQLRHYRRRARRDEGTSSAAEAPEGDPQPMDFTYSDPVLSHHFQVLSQDIRAQFQAQQTYFDSSLGRVRDDVGMVHASQQSQFDAQNRWNEEQARRVDLLQAQFNSWILNQPHQFPPPDGSGGLQ